MSGWGVFSVVLGVFFGLCAVVMIVLDQMRYRKADAVVIDNASHFNLSIDVYAPKLRFKTADGRNRTFQSWCYFSGIGYQKGSKMPVRYHPTITWLNGVNKFKQRAMGPVVFGFFSYVCIALGVQI